MRKKQFLLAGIVLILAVSQAAFGQGLPAGESAGQEEEQTELLTEAKKDHESLHRIRYASDYKEVYQALQQGRSYWYANDDLLDYAAEESAVMAVGEAAEADYGVSAASQTPDYSATNLRDSGVDEADIVKTDGRFIYVLKDGTQLVIRSVNGAGSETVSVTEVAAPAGEHSYISGGAEDMYVDGDRLILVTSEYAREMQDDHLADTVTAVYTYDISDRGDPKLLGSVWQDGYYCESRKIGSIVYVYTTVYPILEDSYESSMLIPYVNGKGLSALQIAIPEVIIDSSYLLVASVDIENPDREKDTLAMVSGGNSFYVSQTSLYSMNTQYDGHTDRTEIVKFSCRDGLIDGVGACYVKGSVNNSFSIDEYNGYLRVLTTYTGSEMGTLLEAVSDLFGLGYYDTDRWVRHNALYVLDEKLDFVGSLKGLAENEEIRSARFFGDTVYFVTFRNTDPLFSADLSDPTHPVILGELSVTGFSSYLHPYGDGLLLGIGYEADPDTGWNTGVKLSMFDVSDPAHVTELDRYVITGPENVPALSDYKAILADPGKNVIGFYLDNRYLLCSYDRDKGFERKLLYDFYGDSIGGTSYSSMRGLYVGDELYLAGPDYLIAFNMADDFKKELVLKEG